MYSRATTSAIAERVVVGFLVVLGWVFGVGILSGENACRLAGAFGLGGMGGERGTWYPPLRRGLGELMGGR